MLDKLIRWSTRYMAVGVMIAGFLGILFPAAMKPYARFIPTLLGIIMFGMGMSLKAEDFRNVFRDPRSVAVGAILQFTIMPLLAYVLVTLLALLLKLPLVSSLWAAAWWDCVERHLLHRSCRCSPFCIHDHGKHYTGPFHHAPSHLPDCWDVD